MYQKSESSPGVLQWLISCDDSGMDNGSHHGFGSLWMKWQRRGDFAELVAELRAKHGYSHECKWMKAKRLSLPFCRALVEEFFKKEWLSFQCIVIRKADVNLSLHDGDEDLAMRKHFTMLLTNKMSRCRARHRGRPAVFHVWCDPIHSREKKAAEVMGIISNHVLDRALAKELRSDVKSLRTVDSVVVRDSKDTVQIQLADLLLGAVLDGWRRNATSQAKLELRRFIASHLGWDDLGFDTKPAERKFNVWHFYDPTRGPRDIETRDVHLKYPYRARRKSAARRR